MGQHSIQVSPGIIGEVSSGSRDTIGVAANKVHQPVGTMAPTAGVTRGDFGEGTTSRSTEVWIHLQLLHLARVKGSR